MDLNKIYNESCFETMKKMTDNSVDLIVTSPNYNNWRNRRTQAKREEYWKRTRIDYDVCEDKQTDGDYMQEQIMCINEMLRILKPTGTICYNHKDRIYNYEVLSPIEWILKTNAVYRQRVTWDRGGMQAYNPVRFYRVEEDIYILGKKAKNFTWNKECAKYLSIWKITPSKREQHPATFPDELVDRCIKAFSNEGDIVYDPYMGSGTTAKMSVLNKRMYIGSEISSTYISIAEEKIRLAYISESQNQR